MKIDTYFIKRISGIALIILGVLFGITWNRTGFCLGDTVFSTLGLPAWSSETSGTHYPAIAGIIMILTGIGVLRTALPKRVQLWVFGSAIVILLLLQFS